MSIGKPWKGYGQDGIRGGMTQEFEADQGQVPQGPDLHRHRRLLRAARRRHRDRQGAERAPGPTWPPARRTSSSTTGRTRKAAASTSSSTARGPVAWPRGRRTASSGWFAFDVADAPHQIELRAVGDGDVRVFGMTLDRAEAGVVVDALGINGAQIFTPLRWNEAHFTEQLRHASPALVVVAYGTNEALEPGLGDTEYERKLVDFLGRIARATPTASCLLLGPPDLARHTTGRTTGTRCRAWPRSSPCSARSPRPRAAPSTISRRRWAAPGASSPGRRSPNRARSAIACTSPGRLRPGRHVLRRRSHARLRRVARGARPSADRCAAHRGQRLARRLTRRPARAEGRLPALVRGDQRVAEHVAEDLGAERRGVREVAAAELRAWPSPSAPSSPRRPWRRRCSRTPPRAPARRASGWRRDRG